MYPWVNRFWEFLEKGLALWIKKLLLLCLETLKVLQVCVYFDSSIQNLNINQLELSQGRQYRNIQTIYKPAVFKHWLLILQWLWWHLYFRVTTMQKEAKQTGLKIAFWYRVAHLLEASSAGYRSHEMYTTEIYTTVSFIFLVHLRRLAKLYRLNAMPEYCVITTTYCLWNLTYWEYII